MCCRHRLPDGDHFVSSWCQCCLQVNLGQRRVVWECAGVFGHKQGNLLWLQSTQAWQCLHMARFAFAFEQQMEDIAHTFISGGLQSPRVTHKITTTNVGRWNTCNSVLMFVVPRVLLFLTVILYFFTFGSILECITHQCGAVMVLSQDPGPKAHKEGLRLVGSQREKTSLSGKFLMFLILLCRTQ